MPPFPKIKRCKSKKPSTCTVIAKLDYTNGLSVKMGTTIQARQGLGDLDALLDRHIEHRIMYCHCRNSLCEFLQIVAFAGIFVKKKVFTGRITVCILSDCTLDKFPDRLLIELGLFIHTVSVAAAGQNDDLRRLGISAL